MVFQEGQYRERWGGSGRLFLCAGFGSTGIPWVP
jgi:hypothetical protein